MLKIYINILIILVFCSCDFLSKEIPADTDVGELPIEDLPNPCESINDESLLKEKIFLTLSSRKINQGQSVTIAWGVDSDLADINYLEVKLSRNEDSVSSEISGSESFIIDEETHFNLEVMACEVTASIEKEVSTYQWSKLSSSGFSVLYQASANGAVWLGGLDNSLWKIESGDLEPTLISSGNRPYLYDTGETGLDGSPITTITKGEGECEDLLFWATEDGFFYVSDDEGRTIRGGSGEKYARWSLVASEDPGLPIPIRKIVGDPKEKSKVFILHDRGIYLMNDCHASSQGTFVKLNNELSNINFSEKIPTDLVLYDHQLFVVTEDGLYQSEDGETWNSVSEVDEVPTKLIVSGGILWVLGENKIWVNSEGTWSFKEYEGSTILAAFSEKKFVTFDSEGLNLVKQGNNLRLDSPTSENLVDLALYGSNYNTLILTLDENGTLWSIPWGDFNSLGVFEVNKPVSLPLNIPSGGILWP